MFEDLIKRRGTIQQRTVGLCDMGKGVEFSEGARCLTFKESEYVEGRCKHYGKLTGTCYSPKERILQHV